jgi:hypothetical protein
MLKRHLTIKQKTEADIAENEEILNSKLGLFSKMISDIENFRKSERNILRATQKIEEIQTHIKKLKAEQELLKYSPANKCGYLHNLSVTISLLKQFEVFHQELKQKDKLRKLYNRDSKKL